MQVKYPRANQLRLLFTDTDSLAYAVQTDDIYKGRVVRVEVSRIGLSKDRVEKGLNDKYVRVKKVLKDEGEYVLDRKTVRPKGSRICPGRT